MQFDNSLINAIQMLANKLNLTVDSTLADSNSKINYYVESQIKVIDLIIAICNYTSHIFKIENNVLKLIDKLQTYQNSTVSREFNEFSIIKDTFKIEDKDVSKELVAKWNVKAINSNSNYKDEEKKAKVSLLGVNREIDVEIYDYIETNILYELNKMKQLYFLLDMSFEVMIDEEVEFLQKISFDDTKFKGEMLVLEIISSENKKTKIIKGIGECM